MAWTKATHLKYGRQSIPINLPPGARLLDVPEPPTLPALADPRMAARNVLRSPIGSPPLFALAGQARRVVITVSDITRQFNAPLFLPAVLDELNVAGVTDDNVEILVAAGNHVPASAGESLEIVGPEVLARVPVTSHDSRDDAALVRVGVTPMGTEVSLNRRVVDAGLAIVTGGIVPHVFAGYGGGRKGILPGIAGRASVLQNHTHCLLPGGSLHPAATYGVLEGNPVHADMVAAARLLQTPVFLFNVVKNSDGEPAAYFGGNLEEAWAAGVELCRRFSEVRIAERADLVIAGMGGFPKDISYYQSVNDYAYPAVAPGGAVIMAAACEDGLGAPDFAQWLRYETPEAMLVALRDNFSVAGYLAYRMWLQALRVPTFFVSGLPPEPVTALGMRPSASLDEAVEAAQANTGVAPRVLIFPRILQVGAAAPV
jgi:nickel-dependent lactate racemase